MKNQKGFIQLAVVLPYAIVILLGAAGYEAYKVFEPGRNKKAIDKASQQVQAVAVQTVTVDQQAKNIQNAVSETQKVHEAKDAARDRVEDNAAGFIQGAHDALATEAEPTQAELVALGLTDSAAQALGRTLSPTQLAQWSKIVGGLLSKNAAAQAQIVQLQTKAAADLAALQAVSARAAASDKNLQALTVEHSKTTEKLVSTASKAATLTKEVQSWADDSQTLWGRIKALGALSVILALIVFLVLVKFFGLKKAFADVVALGEYVKDQAVMAGHDATALEAKIKSWWEGDTKTAAKVQSVKTNILRQ